MSCRYENVCYRHCLQDTLSQLHHLLFGLPNEFLFIAIVWGHVVAASIDLPELELERGLHPAQEVNHSLSVLLYGHVGTEARPLNDHDDVW